MGVFGVAALRLKPTASNFASGLIKIRFYRDAIRSLSEDIKSVRLMEPNEVIPQNHKKNVTYFKELIINQAKFTYI